MTTYYYPYVCNLINLDEYTAMLSKNREGKMGRLL